MAGGSDNPWDRLDRRIEFVEQELVRRKDHAHQLELEVRELSTKMSAMNDLMENVLDGVRNSRDGITTLADKFEVHQQQELERRVSDTESRERERRANARFRVTTIISVLGVLVVVVQIYLQLVHNAGG